MDLHQSWLALPDSLQQRLNEHLAPLEWKYQQAQAPRAVHQLLPFYPNTSLIRLEDRENWKAILPLYFVATETEFYPLDGASPVVHRINFKAPLSLDTSNILDYLKFFCFFVRSEEGPFLIFERPNDMKFIKIGDQDTEKLIKEHIKPAQFNGINSKGEFLYSAIVYYGDILFKTSFAINTAGTVEMFNDKKIADNLNNLNSQPDAPL